MQIFVVVNSIRYLMYAVERVRFRELINSVAVTFQVMALDPRGYPGVTIEARSLKSSASTPSLRSRVSEVVPMGTSTPDNGGGNVRVVVRVRGFLPRGLARN